MVAFAVKVYVVPHVRPVTFELKAVGTVVIEVGMEIGEPKLPANPSGVTSGAPPRPVTVPLIVAEFIVIVVAGSVVTKGTTGHGSVENVLSTPIPVPFTVVAYAR